MSGGRGEDVLTVGGAVVGVVETDEVVGGGVGGQGDRGVAAARDVAAVLRPKDHRSTTAARVPFQCISARWHPTAMYWCNVVVGVATAEVAGVAETKARCTSHADSEPLRTMMLAAAAECSWNISCYERKEDQATSFRLSRIGLCSGFFFFFFRTRRTPCEM
jgi:hypothetical protein